MLLAASLITLHGSTGIFLPFRPPLFLQTSIQTEGFRSLAEGEPVEYYLEAGDDGRTKAVSVTGPNGAPPQVGVACYVGLVVQEAWSTYLVCFATTSTCFLPFC